MTTQEKLEAFAPYLPCKLRMVLEKSGRIIELSGLNLISYYSIMYQTKDMPYNSMYWNFKPILRPISDLTKPCLESGKVPIVELAKIISNEDNWILEDGIAIKHINSYDYYALHFDPNMMFFSYEMWSEENCIIPDKKFNQKLVFDQLYMWHFWLGDQFEFGKSIIDINTINNENR